MRHISVQIYSALLHHQCACLSVCLYVCIRICMSGLSFVIVNDINYQHSSATGAQTRIYPRNGSKLFDYLQVVVVSCFMIFIILSSSSSLLLLFLCFIFISLSPHLPFAFVWVFASSSKAVCFHFPLPGRAESFPLFTSIFLVLVGVFVVWPKLRLTFQRFA